jgi:hypothetical protein
MFENEANLSDDGNLYPLVAETKDGYCLFMESESLMTSSMRLLLQPEVPACKGGGMYAEGRWFDCSRAHHWQRFKPMQIFEQGRVEGV